MEREELEGYPECNFELGRCIYAHVLFQRRVFVQNLLFSTVTTTMMKKLKLDDKTKKATNSNNR